MPMLIFQMKFRIAGATTVPLNFIFSRNSSTTELLHQNVGHVGKVIAQRIFCRTFGHVWCYCDVLLEQNWFRLLAKYLVTFLPKAWLKLNILLKFCRTRNVKHELIFKKYWLLLYFFASKRVKRPTIVDLFFVSKASLLFFHREQIS